MAKKRSGSRRGGRAAGAGPVILSTRFAPGPFNQAVELGVASGILRRERLRQMPVFKNFAAKVKAARPYVQHIWLVLLPVGNKLHVRALLDPQGALLRSLKASQYAAMDFRPYNVAEQVRKASTCIRTRFFHPKLNSVRVGATTYQK